MKKANVRLVKVMSLTLLVLLTPSFQYCFSKTHGTLIKLESRFAKCAYKAVVGLDAVSRGDVIANALETTADSVVTILVFFHVACSMPSVKR